MKRAALLLDELLEKAEAAKKPLLFLVTVPSWEDAEALTIMKQSKFLFLDMILNKNEHYYEERHPLMPWQDDDSTFPSAYHQSSQKHSFRDSRHDNRHAGGTKGADKDDSSTAPLQHLNVIRPMNTHVYVLCTSVSRETLFAPDKEEKAESGNDNSLSSSSSSTSHPFTKAQFEALIRKGFMTLPGPS